MEEEASDVRVVDEPSLSPSPYIFRGKTHIHKVHRVYSEESPMESHFSHRHNDSVSANLVSTRFSKNLTRADDEN